MFIFIFYLFLLKRVEVVENLFIIKGFIKKSFLSLCLKKLVEILFIVVDICFIYIIIINNDL